MERKLGFVCVCMLIFLTVMPVMNATSVESPRSLLTQRHYFPTCYINATGLVANVMFKCLFSGQINNHAFSVFWLTQWDDFNTTVPTTVTIYSEKGGELLWTNSDPLGFWALKMLFYRGVYTTSWTPDDRLVVHLEGNAALAVTLND